MIIESMVVPKFSRYLNNAKLVLLVFFIIYMNIYSFIQMVDTTNIVLIL